MLENYFYKSNGDNQSQLVKREKAVAAVLEIIKANTGHVPIHVSMSAIQNDVAQAADAIQAALGK